MMKPKDLLEHLEKGDRTNEVLSDFRASETTQSKIDAIEAFMRTVNSQPLGQALAGNIGAYQSGNLLGAQQIILGR